jgi:hypothetical protein
MRGFFLALKNFRPGGQIMTGASAPVRNIPRRRALYLIALCCLACGLMAPPDTAAALDINGSVTGDQFGAGSDTYNGNVSGGIVNLNSGGNVTGRVAGGATGNGNVSDSQVNVNGGSASGVIIGG